MMHNKATMSSLPTIVVSGATGNIGTEVVKQLSVVKDVKVRAAVHSLDKARKLPERVEVVQMEYAQPETVLSAFTGATKLFLLPPGDQYDRAETTQMMVQAAKEAGIQYIVLISAISIDREPILSSDLDLYAKVEEIVANSGIMYSILRPSWFNQNFTSRVFGPQIQQGILHLPVGEGKTGWIDCRDIAAVTVKLFTQMGHENKIYNLTGPEALSMSEAIAILSRVTGTEIKFVDISEETYAQMLRDFGVPEWFVHKMIEITRKWRIGSHDDVTQDVEKVTGKKPISFEQFAIDHIDLLRQVEPSRQEVLTA
jgi:uncharacterized protein YbjT (DUF2867 family)